MLNITLNDKLYESHNRRVGAPIYFGILCYFYATSSFSGRGGSNGKIERLTGAMSDLGKHPFIYADARLKKSWVDAGYKETIVEDFHIAYKVETDEDGEQYVAVYDAVHSKLYY